MFSAHPLGRATVLRESLRYVNILVEVLCGYRFTSYDAQARENVSGFLGNCKRGCMLLSFGYRCPVERQVFRRAQRGILDEQQLAIYPVFALNY